MALYQKFIDASWSLLTLDRFGFVCGRLLSWFLAWILRKKAGLNVQVGRVGYFCVRDISVVISSTFTVVCLLFELLSLHDLPFVYYAFVLFHKIFKHRIK